MGIANPIVYHRAGWDEKRLQPRATSLWRIRCTAVSRWKRNCCVIREGGWYYLVHTIYPFHHHTERAG